MRVNTRNKNEIGFNLQKINYITNGKNPDLVVGERRTSCSVLSNEVIISSK